MLSVYNVDYLCFVHADVLSRIRFERVSARVTRYQKPAVHEEPVPVGIA